jgi:hypothetical protein
VLVCCSTDLFVAKKLLKRLDAAADLRHVYCETTDARFSTAKKEKKISGWLLTRVPETNNPNMSAVIFVQV